MPPQTLYRSYADPSTGKMAYETLANPVIKNEPLMLTTENAADRVYKADKSLASLTKKPEEKQTREEKTSEADLVKMFQEEDAMGIERSPELLAAQEKEMELANEVQSLRDQIDDFQITDEELNAQISSITSRYDSRIIEMRDVNRRREKAFETLGYRLGSQYTGGIRAGTFGGVISEEERQGLNRIGELEALKQQEINAARAAQRERKWDIYVEKVSAAEKAFEKQQGTVAELNKLDKERRDELTKERNAIILEENIATLFNQGITDVSTIQSFLSDAGFNAKAKEIQDILDIVDPEEQEKYKGLSADFKTFMTFFPDVDVTTAEGREQYIKWQAQVAAANRKPDDGDGSTFTTKLTPEDARGLAGAGFTPAEISDIQKGVNDFGIDAVLSAITDEKKRGAVQKAYGVEQDEPQFLNTDYFKSIFTEDQLKAAAKEGGFRHLLTSWATEKQKYLDYLMGLVEQYRVAGYSDKEILKMMQ